jgi:folate-binding protein YgfZ
MTDAQLTPIAPGFDTRDDFGDVQAEYVALREGTAVVDRSARLRMIFAGAQPAATLTGLVTNDVAALQPGQGQYAGALTNKGKIIADVRILARADDLLVDSAETCGPGFAAMIRKYVNPRLARYSDVSAVLRCVGVYGPGSVAAVAAVLGCPAEAVIALAPHQHLRLSFRGAPLDLLRSSEIGRDGFDCFVAVEHATELWQAFTAAGAEPVGRAAWEIARVEAGTPRWGVDMDENTLAQEACFDALNAISYTKGCYTGQETVARVHFRGHVNKELRRVHAESALVGGASIVDAEGNVVGDVRSVAESPRHGHIGIAMVRLAVLEQLVAVLPDGTRTPLTVDAAPGE